MSWFITDLSSPTSVSIPLEIVGYARASNPVHTTTNNGGDKITIPLPDGTQEGDLLLAQLYAAASATTLPAGWSTVIDNGDDSRQVCRVIVPAIVPAEYTWTISVDGLSRTAEMVSIRGANTTLGESGFNDGDPDGLTVPDLTNNVEGSILMAFSNALQGGSVPYSVDITPDDPLVEGTSHVAAGSIAYALPLQSIVAAEEDLSVGLISGRSFSGIPPITAVTFGIIVEPS